MPATPAPGAAAAPAPAPAPNPTALSVLEPSLALGDATQAFDFFLSVYRTPPFLLPIYLAAAQRYGIPWEVLAAINEVESDYGDDLSVSGAGAEGWMQFLPSEWLAYGVDANGAGVRDPYNPADAIFAAARYLAAAGAAHNLSGAVYAYNHSSSYVESVMLRARLIAGAPQSTIGSLSAIVDGHYPVRDAADTTVAPAWGAHAHPRAPSPTAARPSSRPTLAVAPPPHLSADASASTAPAVVGVSITAIPGIPVVAVKQAEVIAVGTSSSLGRYIRLRDASGDIYTYAKLGRVLKRYMPAAPTGATPKGSGAPARPAALRKGAWIPSGTVLGNVQSGAPGTQTQFLFEIEPAGAGAIDPRPVLQAWRLLGQAEGQPHPDTQPLFGPGAVGALIGEIELMGKDQLEARLLADPRLRVYACGREDIASGRIDRRVLATLDFLLDSGIDPTVSALRCGRVATAASASLAEHLKGQAVTISALNGVPIADQRSSASVALFALHRLHALPTSLRPLVIAGHKRIGEMNENPVLPHSADRIEFVFTAAPANAPRASASDRPAAQPSAAASTSSLSAAPARAPSPTGPLLTTAQWRSLLTRISALPEPHVSSTPTSAAVADDQSSPPPLAESASAALPLSLAGEPPAALPTHGASSLSSKRGSLDAGQTILDSPLGGAAGSLAAPTSETGAIEVLNEENEPAGSVLPRFGTLRLKTTDPAITSVAFEISESEAGQWKPFGEVQLQTGEGVFESSIRTESEKSGLYEIRAALTMATGTTTSTPLADLVIANEPSRVVTLKIKAENGKIATDLSGTVKLVAENAGESPATFQWAPSDSTPPKQWTEIATVTTGQTTFDTRSLPAHGNGDFDFRVKPARVTPGENSEFVSVPSRDRLVDNKPPTVSLENPGPALHGRVILKATAEDPGPSASEPGSGIASVTFWRAAEGTGVWHEIGQSTLPSQPGSSAYTRVLQTDTLENGQYEFRATAIDRAGNETEPGSVVQGIEIDNPAHAPAVSASVSTVVAPAEKITILGSVADSPQHETWAYGFTSAPPAEANRRRLEYEAQGHQLVMLRYTDETGWQIADVLRKQSPEANEAFPLLPAADVEPDASVKVTGAMTPSGEAWLWVAEKPNNRRLEEGREPVYDLFHRRALESGHPAPPFEYDQEASTTLKPLLETLNVGDRVNLEEGANGEVFGILTAPTGAGLGEGLRYGLLANGKWKLETADAPPESSPAILSDADVQSFDPGTGVSAWGLFSVATPGVGLILGHLEDGGGPDAHWTFAPTGLDTLDLTGTLKGEKGSVRPEAVKSDGDAVWISAQVELPEGKGGQVVARYDAASHEVTESWCSLLVANSCEQPLGDAAVPDTIFKTGNGEEVGLALGQGKIDVFAHGQWTSVLAPGYGPVSSGPTEPGGDAFTSPNEGWIGGKSAIGRWSTESASSLLSSWPLPDRSPLTSVALPPGSGAATGESGALAVGFEGTALRYEASEGWLVQPTPAGAHHANLLGVAFAGPSSAFAVGQFGVILRWDGSSWSEDPQSSSLTQSQLNAVAFAPSGQGWAVGTNGTILHYDGSSWGVEHVPTDDEEADITSVTTAGSEVFAVAGGNLISRSPDGSWHDVAPGMLPGNPAPESGSLRLVAGLPDGGVVAAGNSVMLVRESAGPGQVFQYAPQPLQGTAVALAPYRQADGKLRAYVSLAPDTPGQATGFPAGDGDLLRQSESGWNDLSRTQNPSPGFGDGELKSDPVLSLATNATGTSAWAVGGYDGTVDAAGQGTETPLSLRAPEWRTASVWRYDTSGSIQPPSLSTATPNLPAKSATVSFAFFSSAMCRDECAASVDAQPDVNLSAAAKQIATYATQPGGPAFAMLGGDARGPLDSEARTEGDGAVDFGRLPELLSPLGSLPTFAALGEFDYVAGHETQPWSEAFANAPPPFGSGPAAPNITPVSSGEETPTHEVHRYYAFDTHQNEGVLRVIVLDNSKESVERGAESHEAEALAVEQMKWLKEQLHKAHEEREPNEPNNPAGLPVVVVAAQPLYDQPGTGAARNGNEVAKLLADEGVLAVFTTNGANQLDERSPVPQDAGPGEPQIPEYEGATLGYQQSRNDGVMWYFVSVDTHAREVHVNAIPVLNSLALKPLDGLSVPRSLTLQFEAVGRRPPGTLVTGPIEQPPFPGNDNYAEIPSSASCEKKSSCETPSYSFTSSEPTIGTFVVPSAAGSPRPLLVGGHPVDSSTSGLFCAFNSGSTMVTVTAGLLSYSLPVSVQPGNFGSPCGTVFRAGVGGTVVIPAVRAQRRPAPAPAPPPPPPVTPSPATSPPVAFVPPPLPALAPPPPLAIKSLPPPVPPKPAPAAPIPPEAPLPPPVESLTPTPAILPAATPPVEPIPPGVGGYATSPSAAERREKARKHASQSAFTTRPAGASGEEWYGAGVGAATLLVLLILARTLPLGPRPRPALLRDEEPTRAPKRRPRRTWR